MFLSRQPYVALFAFCLVAASVTTANAPPIGAGARFRASELGTGWHRGFFNQTRTAPPCYILIIFDHRSSPDEARRIKQIISISRVQRLQVTANPGASMQEWNGLTLPTVPENSWHEIELASLRPVKGECQLNESLDS
jgi:hypothetical protein